MSLLDSFPTVDEIERRYGNDGVQEPRNEFVMSPAEYEKTYGPQFSYELKSIIYYANPRAVAESSINYDVSEYHFSAQLGLGVHKKIGLAVVFHRDPRKNYIIPPSLFERYAQGVLSKMSSFREAIELSAVKEKQLRCNLSPHCEVGEPGLEHSRGRISPQCMPLQGVPIHFGFGCDCGIIRRKFREMSRHPCVNRDSTRPVAFQKFPQKYGRMAFNFEVYCPADDGFLEDLARGRGRDTPSPSGSGSGAGSSSSSSSSSASPSPSANNTVQNSRTTTVPNQQHHPLVKKILQEVDRNRVDSQVKAMQEAHMVAKIAQLLVGAMTLLSANINQVNLAGLEVVRLFKGVANNHSSSTYFRAVQTYSTCVQYSKYMAELVYMVLMHGPKTPASLALSEMIDNYGAGNNNNNNNNSCPVLEVNARDYHKLTGYAQFISADERMRILDQTFTESALRNIDQLVCWIMDHCIRKDFDENLAVPADHSASDATTPVPNDINAMDLEGDAIAAGILDDDGDDNDGGLGVYLEAMAATGAPESLASLYYPLYGGGGQQDDEEGEGDGDNPSSSNENAFVTYLGFLGVAYPTKKYCRSLSGIVYMAKTCILLDIIKRARSRRVSLRDAEDVSIVSTGSYRILAQVRTHYTYLGLSLARSEGNLFRLNIVTGDIFNSENAVVGHKDMIRTIFARLYELAHSIICEVSHGEELDYSVDNARLSDGMVSFTECVQVPSYSRYKHRLLELYNDDADQFRNAHSKLTLILITLLHISCLPARSTEIDRLSVAGTSKEYRGVYFLGPTFGFCYNYNKSANAKDPIIREIGPELSSLFLWYVLVYRRMYVEMTLVEDNAKLYQFDAASTDKIRAGISHWFSYGMNNHRKYKFCEVRQILKRCIEFHYTKSVRADLEMYRQVYETIARTSGHSVATSTEHYGTIANYPPSVNAADVLRSRHLGQVWHRSGLGRKFVDFEGQVVDADVEDDVDEEDVVGDVEDVVDDVAVAVDDVAVDDAVGDADDDEEDVAVDDFDASRDNESVVLDADSLSDVLIEVPSASPSPPPSPVISRPMSHPAPSMSHPAPSMSHPAPSMSHPAPSMSHPAPSISHQPSSLASDPSLSPNPIHHSPNFSTHYPPAFSHGPQPGSSRDPSGPPGAYLDAPLYDAQVSREVLREARKLYQKEKRKRKERKREKKRKRKERERQKAKELEVERQREREKQRETLASPVTPVRSIKVKDISLYSSATRGPMCRVGKGSGGSPSVRPMADPPTPNSSVRRLHASSSSSSSASRSFSSPSRSRMHRSQDSPIRSSGSRSRMLSSQDSPRSHPSGSPSFPETPPSTSLSPSNLRRRLTESLQATPLGKFFAPSDSQRSASVFKWPKILSAPSTPSKDVVLISDSDSSSDEDDCSEEDEDDYSEDRR